MDKLMKSPWFVKVIALLLALMLYLSVNIETTTNQTNQAVIPDGTDKQETLTEIPLEVYYDRDEYVMSGIPQTVTVSIAGPNSIVKPTILQQSYRVFVDLTDLKPGTHTVPVQHKNFSNRLDVKVEPSSIEIKVDERITVAKTVEVDYINKQLITEGYTLGDPKITPDRVKITGSKDEVDKIALVKGIIDLVGINKESIKREATVKVYDHNGNQLDVFIDPSIVEVTVPVISPNKPVPFEIKYEGELPKGISLTAIEVEQKNIVIYGPKKVIDPIGVLNNLTVDLSQIRDDSMLQLRVPVPKDVEKVEPEIITVRVDVEPEKKLTLTKVPIKIEGLRDNLQVSLPGFEEPELSINLFGSETRLAAVDPKDIRVIVNLDGYNSGEYEMPIQVVNIPDALRWESDNRTVTVVIETEE